MGIPPEQLTKVLDPFFTTKEKGTGLGLSVVYGVVERHGGPPDARQHAGVGTTVTIRLPLRRAERRAPARAAAPGAIHGAADGRRALGPIALWWIGEARSTRSCSGRSATASRASSRARWSMATSPERPAGTFDARRGQHSSREVLKWLVAQRPAGVAVLGVTDVDLFIPVLTFVFGEAQLEGTAAVVSMARLVRSRRSAATARGAGATEAVHELGHTFGLLHCALGGAPRGPCVMARSASVRAVDAKSTRLCPECRARYLDVSAGWISCLPRAPESSSSTTKRSSASR